MRKEDIIYQDENLTISILRLGHPYGKGRKKNKH